jgi:hypothetical protein
MGWLTVLFGVTAAVLFWIDGRVIFSILSIVDAFVAFWSWGVMHNYATEQAKKRSNYSGGFYDITPSEANAVPDWITNINMLASVISLLAIITSLILVVLV